MRVVLAVIVFFVGLTACNPIKSTDTPDDSKDRREHGGTYPLSSLGVPEGQLPPPGECKIWIPGRPAGQQRPPMKCADAFRRAPLGAWVISQESSSRYRVSIFSKEKRGLVEENRFYED
jgi:hypothetical protein